MVKYVPVRHANMTECPAQEEKGRPRRFIVTPARPCSLASYRILHNKYELTFVYKEDEGDTPILCGSKQLQGQPQAFTYPAHASVIYHDRLEQLRHEHNDQPLNM